MVTAAGIDTWSPCWYVGEGSQAERAMEAMATAGSKRGRLLPFEIDEHRVGWFAGSRLVYAEGHPSAEGLGAPGDLPSRLDALVAAIRDAGIELPSGHYRDHWDAQDRTPGLAGVRRLDATVDLQLPADRGLALLAGIAIVAPDALAVTVRRARGMSAIETVTWSGARGIMGRAYDKSVESSSGPRGTWPRLEAQFRWAAGGRRDPTELTAEYVRDKFQRRFAPLWKASKGIKVVGSMALVDQINAAIEEGALTPAQGEQILGYQLLAARGRRGRGYNARTRQRRRALIREHGLVLADGVLEEVEVDMGELLEEALGTDAWERRG